ncbi:UDP-N-acetylmuramoyl-L-alanyl-D-glutamate--2,6-diaminopimelate ligase [Catenovulum agarivorans]|uniref:UDP-N-acetylmuramoyl-L-alanyl-D-glutamate--2, 6-diaminopimelate ligase n=1 Tax=Catenovulum agarivorans TaxID=1172192 RepID=UPI0002D8A661|nr:UDP-N-acetylmuramoyl-L-alanyl-D-glutamate--2,6-diaminopimelate ligase [Catenovulum agarivorans]
MPDLDLKHSIEQIIQLTLPAQTVAGLAIDSRQIKTGYCFVALQGHQQHGLAYAEQAIVRGATFILAETLDDAEHGNLTIVADTPCLSVYQLSRLSGILASVQFGHPSHKLALVGTTGTNGKTTVSDMFAQLSMNNQASSGYIGTLGCYWWDADKNKHTAKQGLTTPDAFTLQQLLAQMVKADVTQVAIEVSSHALAQNRVSGCEFAAVAFTNLTHDHLDYHQDMQSYFACKQSLFLQNPNTFAVICTDNEYGQSLLQSVIKQRGEDADHNVLAIGRNAAKLHTNAWQVDSVQATEQGFDIKVALTSADKPNPQQVDWHLPLIGEFNINNALTALAMLQHLDPSVLASCITDNHQPLAKLTACAGRMEVFSSSNKAKIVVDFAHTPDALAQALHASRQHCQGKLWVVFGCGGDRDAQKRPLMGKIAADLADYLVITNDNPRSESPEKIVADILAGISAKHKVSVEQDRKKAIIQTLENAASDDLILVAGKGHETKQILADGAVEYDERAFVKQLMEAQA